MATPTFRSLLRSPAPAIGTLLTTGSLTNADVLARSGVDWLWLDMEHGALTIESAQEVLQVVDQRLPVMVRVAENTEFFIKQALDIGASGVIIPFVNTADDARRAVASAKYPPTGNRSVGIARAHGYGANFADYVRSANDTTALIVTIEHVDAADRIDEILAVDGIDGVFIGAFDLAGTMGLLGQPNHPTVEATITTVRSRCRERSVPVGAFSATADGARRAIDDGCSFVAAGIDTGLLLSAAVALTEAIRG